MPERNTDDESFLEELPFHNTPYGFKKRLRFILRAMHSHFSGMDRRLNVLEVGCGTGKLISIPLAQYGCHVTGIDIDRESIDYAETLAKDLPFLQFKCVAPEFWKTNDYDVVICSEVLEHIDNFADFFHHVVDKVASHGVVIITVPNGRGPFERQQVIRRFIQSTRTYSFVREQFRNDTRHLATQSFLNSSDLHVNFFSYPQLLRLFGGNSMQLEQYEGRTFLCGFCFAPLLRLPLMIPLNDWLGSKLPIRMVSDWMFVISKSRESEIPN